MTTDTAAPPASAPRPLTMEDVYRLIGALYLEIETLRRETTRLRELLESHGRAD